MTRGPTDHWCGYVGVHKDHPWFEKSHEELENHIDIHGGLSYSDHCQGDVCHKTDEEDNIWWLGFDCAHAGDLLPKSAYLIPGHEFSLMTRLSEIMGMHGNTHSGTYRNVAFVKKELKKLSKQAKEETCN